MALHPLAGKPAPAELLIDTTKLERAYYANRPDLADAHQLVSFGTSGHRGTSTNGTFTEAHILAITQAICDYRQSKGYTGPLIMGKDTHALSAAAQRTALEVLAANEQTTLIQMDDGFTPTPVVSHAILERNRGLSSGFSDGIIITPSHNPPADGGFKYNPPDGGPADTDVTNWIQNRANELLRGNNTGVRHIPVERAIRADCVHERDFIPGFVRGLSSVLDMDIIAKAGLKIGVDPLGGASVHYWAEVAERFGLDLTVVNTNVDPQFGFMTVDHDGKIRMDCSSPYAMASLVKLKDKFDIAFGNDPDADRHGIVTRSSGLLNPNHFLCVAIRYLLTHRAAWNANAAIGKTLVSSALIDRVVGSLGRRVYEVPVGFKWFAPGLYDGSVAFGGEESAGASFLRQDGRVWTTDKDGLILGLLACEITARTGRDPGEHYQDITNEFGSSYYTRIDTPSTPEQKAKLSKLSPSAVTDVTLAGAPITAKLTSAPGNGAPIGGLKVVTEQGWFAARPSGTENIYKLYAESLVSEQHLQTIVGEAQDLVARSL
ncbi:phosphoglucomutase (alpha-D-glucose-1,6-bisphosphate-dependent) [uncultured Paludibaculum sp.]|uniref:phosphoglucomutase (alpha-D-glucose-1,6-bisphosphate-dependent) n=1 Tax=uncultured Paludibaculum sp. TaxID=1765020 RepID=UPI002AAC2A48|nr:phosphoglucomutase (alpha-D-glucose-1,6-bisphosphate-dependent) [uncultured Paludibaculum sp.]